MLGRACGLAKAWPLSGGLLPMHVETYVYRIPGSFVYSAIILNYKYGWKFSYCVAG